MGDTKVYMITLMILFNMLSRQTSFYISFVMSFSMLINTMMKLGFQDAKPFMLTRSIYPFVCELEFGNPCDETMYFVTFIFAFGLYYYEKLKEQDEDTTDRQKIYLALGLLLSFMGIILFSLQGIYNGTNSID